MSLQWHQTIKVKDLLSTDTSGEAIVAAAKGMIERTPPTAPKSCFERAIEFVEERGEEDVALLIFNDGMNRLYDWADSNRVWLE